ncbi:MAG: hypothetical protein M0030_24495 [Actinomycetota bacterium]|nr:hypothetical protein [Actinomycetota bacterium]
MADTQSRLERRIARDFPEPGSAHGVLQLLAELPRHAGYDAETLASERVQTAIILLAAGDIRRLRQALDLAMSDWRDVLVAAGLANENWPQRLDEELGEPPQPTSARAFRTLEFAPAYSCEIDPELPGAGDWGHPVHHFYRDGRSTSEAFRSRWGTPLIARFTPPVGDTWIGMFEAGGLGGIDGAFACPDPLAALVICDGQAYLVDVQAPDDATTIHLAPITQACSAGPDLIILASFSSLTAIGTSGVIWESHRLGLDNLRIVRASPDGIECICDFIDSTENVNVNRRLGKSSRGAISRTAGQAAKSGPDAQPCRMAAPDHAHTPVGELERS